MDERERAFRTAAWEWTAETVGVEVTPERIAGLVEVTARVGPERLRPALMAVLETQEGNWLPAPGSVIAASQRLAGVQREQERIRAKHDERKLLSAEGGVINPKQMQEIREKVARLAGKPIPGPGPTRNEINERKRVLRKQARELMDEGA